MQTFSSINIALFVTLGFRSEITLHDLDILYSKWSSICEPRVHLELGSRLSLLTTSHVYLDRDGRVYFMIGD